MIFFILKIDVDIPKVSDTQKRALKETYFVFSVGILKAIEEKSMICNRIVIQWYGSPDPYQNFVDPEYCSLQCSETGRTCSLL
jgi:hypothetical protein